MKRETRKNGENMSSSIQNRCIWMTAGVVSFKLCPLGYDCEHCDFDEAMQSEVKSKRGRVGAGGDESRVSASTQGVSTPTDESRSLRFFTFSPGEADDKLYLHSTHLWIRRIGGGGWSVGIDNLLAYVLPTPVEVELHAPGTEVSQNQLLVKMRTQAGTIPLAAPLSGRLLHTNPRLGERPELVQQDPCGTGWLVTMDSPHGESDLQGYWSGTAGGKFLQEEAQHLRFLLKHRGIEIDNIGSTLPDGGARIRYLNQILPGPVCLKLATELIMSGKRAW
jgi:glycine cleavage system H protein